MFFERNVVFIYPLCKELQDLKNSLEENESATVYEMDSVAEFNQLIGVLDQSITFSSDPKKTANYLEDNKKTLKSHDHKNILMSKDKLSSLEFAKLQKMGLNESLDLGLSEKALGHKVDIFFRPFEMALKAEEEKKEKERKLAEKKQLLAMQRLEQKENAQKPIKAQEMKLEKMAIMDDEESKPGFKKKSIDTSFMTPSGSLKGKRSTDDLPDQVGGHLGGGKELKRRTVGEFKEVENDPSLKKTGIEFETGRLNQGKSEPTIKDADGNYDRKGNDFKAAENELKRKKVGTFDEALPDSVGRKRLDLPENELNRKRANFEEVEKDLNRKKVDFNEHHADLNRKRPTFEPTPEGEKKRKKFEEALADMNRKKAQLDEIEADLNRKRKQFEEIDKDLNRKKAAFDEAEGPERKKKDFEEVDFDLKKKRLDLLEELDLNQKKKKLLLDEPLPGRKNGKLDFEEEDLNKNNNNFDEAEAEGKPRHDFEEYEGDLDKKRSNNFDEAELNKKKHDRFSEVEAEKKDRSNNFNEAELEKKKRGHFDEVAQENGLKKHDNSADVYGVLKGRINQTTDDENRERENQSITLEDGTKEEQTLDYSQFNEEKVYGEYSDGEVDPSKLDEPLTPEEIAQLEDITYYDAHTNGIEYYVYLNDFLYRSSLKKDHVLKFISFSLMKEYKGCASFFQFDGQNLNCLLNSHLTSKDIPHGIIEFDENYLEEHSKRLIETEQPTWSDETFESSVLEFIYPYYEDGRFLGIALCHFNESIHTHLDAARAELLVMAAKGLLQDLADGTFKEVGDEVL